jgi:branched-subunit amino acid ABC-type transport system permease component
MHARQNRLAALLFAVVLGALVVAGGGPADAARTPLAASGTCVKPPPRTDDTIHVVGCLTDTREKPPAAVPDVKITVEDSTAKVVGSDTSDSTGIFDIALPGSSIDNLGKTFTINIDKASLPKGAALRDPKKISLKQKISLSSDVFIAFPIGDLQTSETGTLTQGLQLLVGGIVFSLLLAMAALGLSMIFGTTGLTNFAHGELITFGALAALGIDALPGTIHVGGANLTIFTAILFAAVAGGAFGWVQDRALWRPLRHRGTGLIAMMVVSIGLSIFLRSLYQYVAGSDTHQYSQFSSPKPWHWGPVLVTPKDVGVAVFSALVLVVVVLALQRTRIGKATRAVADNTALAASSGINVDRVITVVWIGGSALAGLSGVLLGMTQGFDFQIGFKILLLVFAAVTLGGLGTAWGAIVGAFIIGTFIEVSTLFVPAELKFVGALVVLILVLLVRPQGLLGRAQRIG